MYTAEYNGQVLHDPRFDDEVIAEATCKLAINTAGSLEINIPPTNPLYSKLAIMSAKREVVLYDDGEEVFRGRVTGDGVGINGMQIVTAEGHLAYLNDSIVAPYGTYESAPNDDGAREWDTIAPNNRHDYAEWLIHQHNAQTDASKQYRIGINDLPDAPITRSSTQWPSTKTEITDKLIDDFGCVMSAYMLGGVRYIDFRADGGRDATQTIEFGVNLLDFARTSRAVDAITCIVPVGKDAAGKEFGLGSLSDGPVGDGMTKQGDRILHDAGVTSCGIIVARKSYDVATLDGLVNACCSDLAASQLAVDSIEISATDLHDLDPSIDRIRLGEWVFVSARPLKFEARMMCVSIDIDVSNPGATKYVFGADLPTLTNGNKATAARIRKQESALIERMRPIDQTAKDAAQQAATAQDVANAVWGEMNIRGIKDTGWVWLLGPLNSDGELFGVKYRVNMGVCYVVVDLIADNGVTVPTSGVEVGTIPVGARPQSNVIAASIGKGNNLGQITIYPTGVIKCWLFDSGSPYYGASISYPI